MKHDEFTLKVRDLFSGKIIKRDFEETCVLYPEDFSIRKIPLVSEALDDDELPF